MLRRDERADTIGTFDARRSFLTRMLLAATLLGSVLGLVSTPEPVAAAGWNHFVDGSCQSDYDGQATPGINWYDQYPTTFVEYLNVYLQYYDYSIGYFVNVDSYTYPTFAYGGSNGDLRHYLEAQTGQGEYRGRVYYNASYHGDDYYERFDCP